MQRRLAAFKAGLCVAARFVAFVAAAGKFCPCRSRDRVRCACAACARLHSVSIQKDSLPNSQALMGSVMLLAADLRRGLRDQFAFRRLHSENMRDLLDHAANRGGIGLADAGADFVQAQSARGQPLALSRSRSGCGLT